MQAITYKIAIPEERRISLDLPKEIIPGPAEILVIIQPQPNPSLSSQLTIGDLGWTQERAAAIRAQLASFTQDWDDPRMDVYTVSGHKLRFYHGSFCHAEERFSRRSISQPANRDTLRFAQGDNQKRNL
ncbi:MAG: hypothetical protein FJ009_15035 [Chloroflexi bacterium]|nr:hypothetical protein [Chloroflexota bacterium]